MRRDSYKTSIAFIDLLFNITVGIAMLFIIAFLMINPVAKKGDIVVNAEFMITMSWPKGMYDDIDLYVQDPAGNVVFFKQKDRGLMNLNRDDLGFSNDVVHTESGSFVHELNEENVTIRGILPGEYIVNAHWFAQKSQFIEKGYVPSKEVPVTVKIEKLNPYRLIDVSTEVFQQSGQEITFLRFIVDSAGAVVQTNKLQYKMVKQSKSNSPGAR